MIIEKIIQSDITEETDPQLKIGQIMIESSDTENIPKKDTTTVVPITRDQIRIKIKTITQIEGTKIMLEKKITIHLNILIKNISMKINQY